MWDVWFSAECTSCPLFYATCMLVELLAATIRSLRIVCDSPVNSMRKCYVCIANNKNPLQEGWVIALDAQFVCLFPELTLIGIKINHTSI